MQFGSIITTHRCYTMWRISTTKVDTKNQSLINHKYLIEARHPPYCIALVSGCPSSQIKIKMNREIKFRGWFQGINGTEIWVYGYLAKQTNGNWEITNGETYWTVDNVCQFTGYFDKNGKEIYEGDQLHICVGYSSVVKFQDGMFVSVYSHPEDGETIPLIDAIGKDTVIIGNVF